MRSRHTDRTRRLGLRLALTCASSLALAVAGTMPAVATAALPGQGFLPDNRAWELVSPPDKNGGEISGDAMKTTVAVDGGAIGFTALAAFADAVGTGVNTEYMSVRGQSGWATHAITPPQEPTPAGPLLDWRAAYNGEFSPDLSKGIFRAVSPLTDAPNVALQRNLYLRDDLRTPGPGSYRLLTGSVVPLPRQPLNFLGVPSIADASADLTRIIFESHLNLTADASGLDPTFLKLYLWDSGTVHLAGILPDSACGSPPCPAPSSAAGLGVTGPNQNYTQGTMSDDGRRIFFTSPVKDGGDPAPGAQLYMRVDGTETVRVSASEKAAPDPAPADAEFQAATPDGSKVFFTSSEQLTDEAGSGLYLYDTTKPHSAPDNLTLLASGGGFGGLTGVMGVSEDGGRVYLVARAQLVPEAPSNFQDKLYLWDHGAVRYIGTLTESLDRENGMTRVSWGASSSKSSRVTPDGSRLMFLSHSGIGLTDVAHSEGCRQINERACSEVYVYDALANGGEGELTCASCNPAGGSAEVHGAFATRTGASAIPPGSHLNHPLSDDGSRVFFTSAERLVPEDRNGGVQDVYQYDTKSREVRLLSSGRDTSPSYFLEADPSGRNVAFITRAQLVGRDIDQGYDLYTARIGGGFPEPAPPPPTCSGDECQGPSSGGPVHTPPGSPVYRGTGNPTAATAAPRCRRLDRRAARTLRRARLAPSGKARKLRRQARVLRTKAKRCKRGNS